MISKPQVSPAANVAAIAAPIAAPDPPVYFLSSMYPVPGFPYNE